jgi:hypothetical protein
MAEAKKREKNFERSYSDKSGEIEISHNDDTVLAVAINGKPAEGDTPEVKGISPDVLLRAGMRYITDILVGVGNAVLKAEGGTLDKAQAKMNETLASLQDGTFKFRAASGQGGLSIEEEQAVIADTIVALGKAATKEEAMAKVAAVYGRTKTNAKGYTVRPDYNALKAVPQVKAALANASKAEGNIDELLSI